MSMSNEAAQDRRNSFASLRDLLAGTLLMVIAGAACGQEASNAVAQSPLTVVGNVPSNLLLVPSVEWPMIDSVANLGDYDVARVYVGYFDPAKCYGYSYSDVETDRHFHPVSTTATRTCSDTARQWSGNYLNWAATQTIDPFRKALTGGYRVRDTATETWLEKARYDGNGDNSVYPNRRIPANGSSSSLVSGATPANWTDLTHRIWRLGNRMRFTRTGDLNGSMVVPYDPSVHTTLAEGVVYEVSVRVKVCDSVVGVEANCVRYSRGWKPEGLIQKHAERIRYGVFGYLNDDSMLRDGGVLRARLKFVGANTLDPANDRRIANANREWDLDTGVLVRNPDVADARATAALVGQAIGDSGVINYINKLGQMTSQNHKSHDPVSELYYAAIRYLKRRGNVTEYSSLIGTSSQRYDLADGFPVITDWEDPIQYRCQKNALLGIGDAVTHRDKNLPGSEVSTDEPARPSSVSSDNTVNVVTATQKVAQLEGITIQTPFTGRENSAFIAGLAYDSHTRDVRADLDGMQTVSTYWVDVRESQVLEPRARNQYWLAAKYGGFAVPENYEPYARTVALEDSLWSSGEMLPTGDVRPENFYVAGEAHEMVASLARAFARIAAQSAGSASALAASSTRVDSETRLFQAQFFSGTWRGDLRAFSVQATGRLSNSPRWRAGPLLTAADWSNRPIYFHNPQGGDTSTRYRLFTWDHLGSNQAAALGSQEVVDYLRGNRTKEESQVNGTLRTRTGVLGDIVNSTPIFVGAPNVALYARATFDGADEYAAFARRHANRTGVVYVGANDGMLHGFSAATGAETYAFIPNAAIVSGLSSYSDPAYEHRYFVDGELTVADVYDTSDSKWKTILVGTMGRGGPGVFALDVTDPASVKFLWEKSGSDIPALGKNIGRPVIAQLANGDWRVLIGNGHETSAGAAQLVMIALRTGTVTVANTGVAGNNALTAVLARDSDNDGFADTAYAGDLRGNLWKFTKLHTSSPSAQAIFKARDPSGVAQPITAAPLAGKDPSTGITWVFFGTGRYLSTADPNDRQVQTWYGIKDTGVGLGSRSDLVNRDIISETRAGSVAVRVVEDGAAGELEAQRGWFMDLLSPSGGARGERMVVPNRFQGAALLGTTRIPEATQVCRPTGTGFVMAINPFTGARLDSSIFDVNRDGQFTDEDEVMVDDEQAAVSGVGLGEGSSVIVAGDQLYANLDSSEIDGLDIRPPTAGAGRMSWREIVN